MPLRLALNENISGSVALALRRAGYDVLSVKETMCGADDRTVLARAQAETRILVTQDKDFGELAFNYGLPGECGIIFFRLSNSDPEADKERMRNAITSRDDWAGHFAVVSDDRIRMRPLPSPGG